LRAFSSSSNSPRPKKSLQDRTPQEATELVRDLLQAVIDAGPRAGPIRTLQASRAISETSREFLPQLVTGNVSIPKVLRTLFERLGATYIKLGQFVASSPTIFPAEYVREFQKCLDQTDPLPWRTVESVLRQEWGPNWENKFASVDRAPLASASIAQVHRATLRNGDQVVLKVQKPGIDATLRADLGFVYASARLLEFVQPDWERTSLSAVASDIRTNMLEELNFEQEARNTIEFRRFLQDEQLMSKVTAPRVYLEHSTKKVLVLEWLDGVSLVDEGSVSSVAADPVETILTALNVWSLSVTKMPFFHADVHAGNLLLLKDGRIGFIDFGIVGKISEKVLNSVTELSTALTVNDSRGMAQALCNMGATDENVNIDGFARDIEALLARVNAVEPDLTIAASLDGTIAGQVSVDEGQITDLVLELVQVTENNGLKLPREFGLLVKQSLYFDRYLKILAPNVDVLNDDRVMIGGISSSKSLDGNNINGLQEENVIDV